MRDMEASSPKKDRKRKAEDEGLKRSRKKIKRVSTAVSKVAFKGKAKAKATKATKDDGNGTEDVREGSLGWEDVDDGDLAAHAAYVIPLEFVCSTTLMHLPYSSRSLFDDPGDEGMVVLDDDLWVLAMLGYRKLTLPSLVMML